MTIKMYAKPSKGKFTISISKITRELQLTVISATGEEHYQRIIETTSDPYQTVLDLLGLSKGMYFLKLESGKETFVQKLIIE